MSETAYVYILQSEKNGRYYIGSTEDVDRRYRQHKSGKHHSSKRIKAPRLVFTQQFVDINVARKIERRLKNFKRKDFIAKIIKDGFIENTGP